MFYLILKELLRKKSLLRTLMNLELRQFSIRGNVVDIGGGGTPSYLSFLHIEPHTKRTSIDFAGDIKVDLETTRIPLENNSANTVLMFNVLEHIFNYRKVLAEAHRLLAPSGQLIGFVPFLIQYHPDPSDYFRYTGETLKRLLEESDFSDIQVRTLGMGPLAVGFNTLLPYLPRIMSLPLFCVIYPLDALLIRARPKTKEMFPLGYLFSAKK